MKKLYRSMTDRKLVGVCAGVAEYFGIDPTVVRTGFAVLCCMGGSGILAYFVAAVLIPENPEYIPN